MGGELGVLRKPYCFGNSNSEQLERLFCANPLGILFHNSGIFINSGSILLVAWGEFPSRLGRFGFFRGPVTYGAGPANIFLGDKFYAGPRLKSRVEANLLGPRDLRKWGPRLKTRNPR